MLPVMLLQSPAPRYAVKLSRLPPGMLLKSSGLLSSQSLSVTDRTLNNAATNTNLFFRTDAKSTTTTTTTNVHIIAPSTQ